MAPERRLDRLENIVKLMIKAGRRERKETREKINALIEAHMRHEEAYAQSKQRTDEAMVELARAQANTQEALARSQMRTEETPAQLTRRTDEEMARLTRVQVQTAESLKTLIGTVD